MFPSPQNCLGTSLGGDSQRTPFPWDFPAVAGPGAGFTSGKPWLPLGAQAETRNCAKQISEPRSILNLYKSMIRVRRENAALTYGSMHELEAHPKVLMYQREAGKQKIVVAVNFDDKPQLVELPGVQFVSLLVTSYLDGLTEFRPEGYLRLRPNEAVAIELFC